MKREIWKLELAGRRSVVLLTVAVFFAFGCLDNAFAKEVYKWTDENGVVHFGDLPPDNQGSQAMQLEDVHRSSTTAPEPVAGEASDSPSGPVTDTDEESPASIAQQRREQIAEDRQERKEAREEREALCARHKNRLEQMEPARRVFLVSAKGEEVRLDDDQRMEMIKEDKDYIAKNCD